MWVQVYVSVTQRGHSRPLRITVSAEGIMSADGPWVSTERELIGIVWARSEDLPPVTPANPVPVSGYKRTVQVHCGNGPIPERIFQLIGAWSPQPGQLIADRFEEIP